MKLTVHTFMTIDGVMQGPGCVEEDRSGGFDRGGWPIPYADQDMGEIVDSWFARTGAVLLGRSTYESMRTYWSQVDDPANSAATALNHGLKYDASRTLTDAEWGNTTVLSGDVVAEVARLKETGDDAELQVHGSEQLAAAPHEAGLVDEYRLLVLPVTVGAGKRLFTDNAGPCGFRLVESRATSTGAQYSALVPTSFDTGTAEVAAGKEVL